MRFSVALLATTLAAVATANPMAYPAPEVTLVPTRHNGTNGTTHANGTATGHHNPHKEPTPTFKLACDCPKPIVPADLLSDSEKCEFEFAAAMGCYFRSNGGCPSPTSACGTSSFS